MRGSQFLSLCPLLPLVGLGIGPIFGLLRQPCFEEGPDYSLGAAAVGGDVEWWVQLSGGWEDMLAAAKFVSTLTNQFNCHNVLQGTLGTAVL